MLTQGKFKTLIQCIICSDIQCVCLHLFGVARNGNWTLTLLRRRLQRSPTDTKDSCLCIKKTKCRVNKANIKIIHSRFRLYKKVKEHNFLIIFFRSTYNLMRKDFKRACMQTFSLKHTKLMSKFLITSYKK